MTWIESHQHLLFYLLLGLALILTRIPILGKYFRGINTLVHEAGHAFTTLLVSGEVIEVNLFSDTSGTTVTRAKGKFARFLIALAGYPFSSLFAWLCMMLLSVEKDVTILFILTCLALIVMILSLRNFYGLFWAGTFSVLNLLILYFDKEMLTYGFAAFYSAVIFTDSIFSAIVLLVLSFRQPKKAGDATNLGKITGIPAQVWSVLILVFVLFVSYFTVIRYFPSVHSLL
jgi:hypothetical protein